ncbi:MAG TPA: RidA family protein [Bryobacteraceae bacterium]|nr:RidA family protein [Bryobacteraceae bacterium]
MPRTVSTDRAPRAIGPYSQAVIHGDLVFLSGQIALDAATGQLVDGDIAAQTRRVLDNIQAVLEAAGSSLRSVLRTTVFLKDMSELAAMNAVYGDYFPENPPARSTVQAARLPRDVSIEIDVIAALER